MARAAKNPTVSAYPDLATPLQVDAPSADPRPGYSSDITWASSTGVPDPIGLVKPFSGIGTKFPKGEKGPHNKPLLGKGGK